MRSGLTKTTLASLLLLAAFLAGGVLFAQNPPSDCAEGEIGFMPVDKDHEKCINFRTTWYYPIEHASGWVLHVREVNTRAGSHIWNGGQYLLSHEEWERLRGALNGQGLAERCLPPNWRQFPEDRLTPRSEFCAP